MRVALLNDLPVAGASSSGMGSGAELTCGRFQREGIQRGHMVDIVTPEYATPEVLASDYDLIVAKNVTAFPEPLLRTIMEGRVPYVAWPSDYAWSRWRLYFAFQEAHKRLPKTGFFREWFTRSRLNVFLSPLHRDAYHWIMPELGFGHPETLSPPPVQERFLNETAEEARARLGVEAKPKTAVTINGGLDFKGLHKNLTWGYEHPDITLTFVGSMREHVQLPPNARFVGRLSWDALHRLLLETETYVELPASVQPANQSAAQGFLSCQRVVTNENLGVASWEWFQKGDRAEARRVLSNAMPDLWARIEKEVAA